MKLNCKHSALALLMTAAASICSVPAYAQAGEKTLGIAGGYASHNNGGEANIYFHYSFSQHVRIAPEIGYVFRNEGKSAFECSVDVHFPFRVARGFKVYPLTGVTLNNWSHEHGGHITRGGLDFGGGVDLYLTSSLKLNLQGKYSLMNDTSGCFVQMGIGYVF
ncbi:MAG: hypothetical protein K2L34_02160 [Muribaculaceae bacterium]|nr:hypothetical protein [Muribaculaceae bacterium]